MPDIKTGEITISYQERGDGFPLMLLHGLSDDSNLWALLTPQLSTAYRTIATDARGHGRSSKPDMPYSIRLFADDLNAFLESMGISRAHVMGLSMGAATAQQFALDYPRKVRSLILLSAFNHSDATLRDGLTRMRVGLVKGGISRFFDEAVKLVVTPQFIAGNAAGIAASKEYAVKMNSMPAVMHAIDACLEFDTRDRTAEIAAPTLIVSGREDALTPIGLAEEIHGSIAGSNRVVMDGVGHNLITPGNAPKLARIVMDFLGEVDRG